MTANEKTLNTFVTRIRQMILRFDELKKEKENLHVQVEERDREIKRLQARLMQLQRDYDSLKMAKMLMVTDGDMETAQKHVAKLIRDVNKCITLLSEK